MTDPPLAAPAAVGQEASGPALRLAVLDRDSGFLQVLSKLIERLGWEHRIIGSAVPVERMVASCPESSVVARAATNAALESCSPQ